MLEPQRVAELVNAHYPIDEIQSCSLIRRGFNDHYLVSTPVKKYVFRVYLNGKYYVESPDAFHFELELLDHLNSEAVSVVGAHRAHDGELLGWTPTEHGQRAFALFPYAQGRKLDERKIRQQQSFELGKTMAEIHLASDRFRTERKRYRLDLKYLLDEPLRLTEKRTIRDHKRIKSFLTSLLYQKKTKGLLASLGPIENVRQMIADLGSDQGVFGIIHGDMHTGNLHFKGNQPVIFDFDHCAYGWRAYDLAISFSLPDAQRDSMLEGYYSLRKLSDQEQASLPTFAKLRQLWDIGDILATEELRTG